jgi:hypothetical protein
MALFYLMASSARPRNVTLADVLKICSSFLPPKPGFSTTTGFGDGANLLFARSFGPYTANSTGTAVRAKATKPSNEPAQLIPMLTNIWRAKSGQAAAKVDRTMVFAAMADGAPFVT